MLQTSSRCEQRETATVEIEVTRVDESVFGLPLPEVGSRIELGDVQLGVSPVNF